MRMSVSSSAVLTAGLVASLIACSGGIGLEESPQDEGSGSSAISCTAPGCDEIHSAILAANPTGFRTSKALNSVTLPAFECLSDTAATYSISGNPSWLALSSDSHVLSLNGVESVPADADDDYSVTYAAAAGDQTFTVTCVFNDSDGDGANDEMESDNKGIYNAFPTGYIKITEENELVYLPESADGRKLVPSVIVGSPAMDFTVADADSDIDFDGYGFRYEIFELGSNPLLFTSLTRSGGFTHTQTYAVGDMPAPMNTLDFDGDGILDLLVTNIGGNSIYFMKGNGDGTFASAVTWANLIRPQLPGVGDFDADGSFDVAVPSTDDETVRIFRRASDGSSQAVATYNVLNNPLNAAVGDLDKDRKLDLVIGYDVLGNTEVTVLWGNGDGTFEAPVEYEVGAGVGFPILVDVDLDNILDIVISGGETQTIGVLPGQSGRTFGSADVYNVEMPTTFPTAADFNGDGYPDIAVTNQVNDRMLVMINDGDGTFTAGDTYPTGVEPGGIVAGDWDGDDKADLALVTTDSDTLSIFWGMGDGTFANTVNYSAGDSPIYLNVGDYNGDRKIDIVVANFNDDNIYVFINEIE